MKYHAKGGAAVKVRFKRLGHEQMEVGGLMKEGRTGKWRTTDADSVGSITRERDGFQVTEKQLREQSWNGGRIV